MKLKIVSLMIVLMIVLTCSAFFLFRWFNLPAASVISEEISTNSKQRFETMKASGEVKSSMRTSKNAAGEVIKTTCFETIIPFPFASVRDSEEKGSCLVRAQLVQPRGVFVVHSEYTPSLSSVTETSGVKFRSENSEYEIATLKVNKSNTLAYKSDTELTVFLFASPQLITISFSEMGRIDDEVILAAENTINTLDVLAVEHE